MARRMIPAKLEEQLQKLNSNISEDGKLYLNGIVDADGNPRFIEGGINNPAIEGLNLTYAKWSLSGTHFMVVIAGQIDASFERLSTLELRVLDVPEYVLNKIVPTGAQRVETKLIDRYRANTNQIDAQFTATLSKTSNPDYLNIYIISIASLANATNFRMQFDLLIDSEQAGE